MKLKCNIISGIMILFLTLTVNPAKASKIANFMVSDPFITVGEGFDVTVSVLDDGTLGDLTGFGFDVDPLGSLSLISFEGYTTVGTDYDDWGGGSHVEGLYLGTGNSGTDVLLATLSFTALSIGIDTLEIKGEFDFDSFSYGLFYEFGDESIEGSLDIIINQAVTPIPEPATILLLATGMAGLGVFSRKKFRQSKV